MSSYGNYLMGHFHLKLLGSLLMTWVRMLCYKPWRIETAFLGRADISKGWLK